MNKKGKRWTQDDIDYLENAWGVYSIKTISKNLKRTVAAVKLKAGRIGLDDARNNYNGITISQLSKALNIHYGILMNWKKKYGFPVKEKVFAESMSVKVIGYEDFWKWAEQHKEMIDFSRMEENILGPEKDWVKVKRNADRIRKLHIPKPHNTPWTKREIGLLKGLIESGCSYPELQRHIQRTEGAIKRKLLDIGIKYRPERLPNHNKYTEKEIQYILQALKEGRSFEEMAETLNRSALGIRGKLERMGYKFKNGVPYKDEKGEVV